MGEELSSSYQVSTKGGTLDGSKRLQRGWY